MGSMKDISVNHDVEMYSASMKYFKENELMARKYFDYIIEYCDKYDNFLELGIGFGETIKLLDAKFKNLIVLDAEEKLIDEVQDSFSDITFHHTYFEDYKPARSFDNIGMGFVLDLVEDPVRLLKQYASYLTGSGKIFLSIQSASSLHRKIAYHAGLLSDIKQMSNYDRLFNHQFYKTFDELIALFEEADLKIVLSHGLFMKSFSTSQIESLALDDRIYNSLAEVARDLPELSSSCFFLLENR